MENKKVDEVQEKALKVVDGSEMSVDQYYFGTNLEQRQRNTFTTIDTSTPEGKALAFKCMSAADTPNEQLRSNVFEVQNIFIHEVNLEDENTGEKMKMPRTVLVNPKGETTAFVSQGVLTSLENLAMLFGMPPWKPALKVRVKETRTRKNFRVYNLELVQ